MPPVGERVYRVQAPYEGNAVHLYLIRGTRLALIDSGASDSPSGAIADALRTFGVDWSDLDYLLNTHGHADHAGGNAEVRAAAPNVAIAIHTADRYLLEGPEAHLNSPTDVAAAMRLMGRDDLVQERAVVLRRVVGKSTGVDRVLDEDDVVDLGNDVRLRVVHTPGHTAGSVCFVWESGRTVFTGDAVQGHGWKSGVAPIYHDLSYVQSLDKIEALGAEVLCMGHTFGSGGVLNDPVRHGAEIRATLQASRDASAAIERAASLALANLGHDAAFSALAESAFRELVFELPLLFDRRTIVPPAAARAIRAHLEAEGYSATP